MTKIPNPPYVRLYNDSLVYTVFESKNNCVSLRGIEYTPSDIRTLKNNTFWLSIDFVKSHLGEEYQGILEDLINDNVEAHLAVELATATLSVQAKLVLKLGTDLWIKSLPLRKGASTDTIPCLGCWDAGYYQLKNLWRDNYLADFEELRKQHIILKRQLAECVYDCGMLPR
jgi:hypothetical protein